MIPARVETVVLFLPDVWSCVPTRIEWDSLHHSYKTKLEQKLCPAEQQDIAESGGATTADEKALHTFFSLLYFFSFFTFNIMYAQTFS